MNDTTFHTAAQALARYERRTRVLAKPGCPLGPAKVADLVALALETHIIGVTAAHQVYAAPRGSWPGSAVWLDDWSDEVHPFRCTLTEAYQARYARTPYMPAVGRAVRELCAMASALPATKIVPAVWP
jgi:hypothetical protein